MSDAALAQPVQAIGDTVGLPEAWALQYRDQHLDQDGNQNLPMVEPDQAARLGDVSPADEDWGWRKGEYRIIPYGSGWLNVAFESSRTTTGAFALFVQSDDLQGEPSFIVNARATRLGFEVLGPTMLGASTAGRIELDFHGQAETENRSGVLLRHAYGEFTTPSSRFVAGQTWDVISPLLPYTVNYGVGWAAGNIGHRRAQIRGEQFLDLGEAARLTMQASLNRSIVVDFAGSPDIQGEDAGWPTVMGRLALATGELAEEALFAELGVSGHIGQEGVDFQTPPVEDDRRFLSWSLNVDLRFTVLRHWGFQGEFFWGEVLGTFLGGINQGIDPVTRRGIGAIGGWGEAWVYWTPQLHSHVGYGIDDPRNNDLGFAAAGRRTLNQFAFANVWYDITPLFDVGFELSLWHTDYVTLRDGEALRAEMAVRYSF